MTMSEQARRCSFCSTKKFSFKFYCVVLNEVTRTFKAPRCRCFLPQSLYFSLIHGFFVEAFLSLLFGLFFVSSVLVCVWCGDLRLKSFRVRQQLLIFVVGSNHSSYSQTHEVRGLVDVLCSSRLRL